MDCCPLCAYTHCSLSSFDIPCGCRKPLSSASRIRLCHYSTKDHIIRPWQTSRQTLLQKFTSAKKPQWCTNTHEKHDSGMTHSVAVVYGIIVRSFICPASVWFSCAHKFLERSSWSLAVWSGWLLSKFQWLCVFLSMPYFVLFPFTTLCCVF